MGAAFALFIIQLVCGGGMDLTTATLGEPIARDSGWEGKKAWAAGFFMSTLTVVLLFALADVYYPNNDDVFILRAFMGFQPSGPATFSPFQYPPMTWFLFAISRLIPKVAWFSVLQIVLLWLSNMVIVKSVVQGFARWNQPVCMGLLVSGCFTLLFAVRAGARGCGSSATDERGNGPRRRQAARCRDFRQLWPICACDLFADG